MHPTAPGLHVLCRWDAGAGSRTPARRTRVPAFEIQARPVIPVEDAVQVELEAIAWRDGLTVS